MPLSLADVDLTNLDTFVEGVPHDQFDLLRDEAPVYFHEETDGGKGFWCITRRDDLRQLSHDWASASSAGGITLHETDDDELQAQARQLMMITLDPPKHTKLRLLVNKGFTPRMIGRLHERIREIARDIVDKVADRGECDFVVDVAAELPLQVIAEMMGVPQEDRHKVFDWSNRMIGSEDAEYAVTAEDATRAAMEMFAYANELAAEKRANPTDDIISVLLQAEVEGERLTDMEFDVFFQLLAVAGNETTRNLISHGMLALNEHPEQRAQLSDDRSKLAGAVDEMLRYASPVMYFRRNATRDMEYKGQHIAEGDKVSIWFIAANRDEDVFEDPHRFDLRRDPNPHVAFGGGGPHHCLGSHLARMEIKVLFEELVARVSAVEALGPPVRLRSNFINGIKHLPVRLVPR